MHNCVYLLDRSSSVYSHRTLCILNTPKLILLPENENIYISVKSALFIFSLLGVHNIGFLLIFSMPILPDLFYLIADANTCTFVSSSC